MRRTKKASYMGFQLCIYPQEAAPKSAGKAFFGAVLCPEKAGIVKFRKAGIRTFVYTSRSSNALMNLCAFAEEGCRIGEACTLRHKDDMYGPDVKGLHIHIS